jgi:hypothetical protein
MVVYGQSKSKGEQVKQNIQKTVMNDCRDGYLIMMFNVIVSRHSV